MIDLSKGFSKMRFRAALRPCAVHVGNQAYSDLERRLIRGNIGRAPKCRNWSMVDAV
jgi:hypothetical protein